MVFTNCANQVHTVNQILTVLSHSSPCMNADTLQTHRDEDILNWLLYRFVIAIMRKVKSYCTNFKCAYAKISQI